MSSSRRAVRKGEPYWALLRAVPRTVAKAGFRGLTYRRLAKEAGINHGLISYYFGSRDTLIKEAASLAVDEAISRSKLSPGTGTLDDFAGGLFSLVAEERDAQAFQFELECEALRDEALLQYVRKLYDRYITTIDETLEGYGLDVDEATSRVVFAALDGLALQQLIYGDEKNTEDSVIALRRMLKALGESA